MSKTSNSAHALDAELHLCFIRASLGFMNWPPSAPPFCRVTWRGTFALVSLALLLVLIAITNFPRKPSALNRIVNNLRQIQGAKEQWAWENHETNDVLVTPEVLDAMLR